jgi:hypothetical protein
MHLAREKTLYAVNPNNRDISRLGHPGAAVQSMQGLVGHPL